MHRLVGLLALVAACSGKGGDDGVEPRTDTVIDDTSGPPIDTAPEEYFVDAAFFAITARFAFDAETQQHVEFAEDGTGLQPIQLVFTLMDSSVAEDGVVDATNSCEVILELAGPRPIASWVADRSQWVGVDVPADATVRDRCRSYILPGEFGGDAAAAVTSWSWSFGVGPIDDAFEEALAYSLPPSEWAALEPYVVGGALISPFFGSSTTASDGFTNQGFAIGYEVDGNFEVEVGGTGNPIPIPKEQIPGATGGVATAYYEVTMGPWTPGTALAYR